MGTGVPVCIVDAQEVTTSSGMVLGCSLWVHPTPRQDQGGLESWADPPGYSPSPTVGTLDIQRSVDAETARRGIVRSHSQGDTAPEQGNRARMYLIQAHAPPSQVGRMGRTRVFTGEQMTWGGRDLILSPRVLFPGAWTQGQPGVPEPGRPALQPCGLPTWDSPACSAPVPGNPHESCYLEGRWGSTHHLLPSHLPASDSDLGEPPKEPQGQARSGHSNPGPVSRWHQQETWSLKSLGEQTEPLKGAGPPALGESDSGPPWELPGAMGEKRGRSIEPGFASNHSGYLG